MNLEIREFLETIRKYVNASGVPAEAKRLVLNEILREAEQQANEELLKEIEERDRREGKDAESV